MTGGSYRLSVGLKLRGAKLLPNQSRQQQIQFGAGKVQSLAFGTGSGRMTIEVDQTRGLPAGASETHNLFDGSLLDIYGDAAKFRRLLSYCVWIDDGGDSAGVTIGGAASNPTTLFWGGTTPTKTIYPDGAPDIGGSPAGVAITSTACNLKITNNGAVEVSYRLVLAGSVASSGVAMGVLGLTYP